MTLTIAVMTVLLLGVVKKLFAQQKQIQEMEEILDAVVHDVQEVRSVTHGKPTIQLP